LRASALDSLRGVYERQHEWQQALDVYRLLARIKAAPLRLVAAHYMCELAGLAIERGEMDTARRLLRDAHAETAPFPRAAVLRAQVAERDGDYGLAIRLLRTALREAPKLMQEELPHLLRLVAPDARDAVLVELVAQAESRDLDELKHLVFAAISAELTDAAPLRAPIEKIFAQDATLQSVWRSSPGQFDAERSDSRRGTAQRIAHEIGALLAHAEKYRCNECGFAGRNFYWHCPACHAWDSFEPYAIVKLG
jgi:lipopolysaccharide biosynthesis regulator YciM